MRNVAFTLLFSITLALLAGCGGGSSKTAENKNDSSSDRPNRNSGGADQGGKGNATPQTSNVTFSEETRLPSDIPIPAGLQLVDSEEKYGNNSARFKTDIPKEELMEDLLKALKEKGWRTFGDKKSEVDRITVYKSKQEIATFSQRAGVKDLRLYILNFSVGTGKTSGKTLLGIRGFDTLRRKPNG